MLAPSYHDIQEYNIHHGIWEERRFDLASGGFLNHPLSLNNFILDLVLSVEPC